jgi:hypothetical protein
MAPNLAASQHQLIRDMILSRSLKQSDMACHGMKPGLYNGNDLILIQEELTKEEEEESSKAESSIYRTFVQQFFSCITRPFSFVRVVIDH